MISYRVSFNKIADIFIVDIFWVFAWKPFAFVWYTT